MTLLLMGAAGLALGLLAVRREWARAAAERELAAANLDLARTAVDSCLRLALEEPALQQKGMGAVRGRLLENAVRHYEALRSLLPGDRSIPHELARYHFGRGQLRADQGDPGGARAAYQKAAQLLEGLTANQPGTTQAHADLARTYLALGRLGYANTSYAKAEPILAKLAAANPGVVRYELELAEAALQALIDGRAEPKAYDRPIGLLEKLKQRGPQDASVRLYLRRAYAGRAGAFLRAEDGREAVKDWEQALQLCEPSERLLLQDKSAGLAAQGQHVYAVAVLAEPIPVRLRAGVTVSLYELAGAWSLASAAATQDKKLRPDAREPLAAHYARLAVELLAHARADGFFRDRQAVEALKKDRAFAPLRSHPGFQGLIADLEKQPPGNG
jgi:hypothetical protein